jgi:hypothetical protein
MSNEEQNDKLRKVAWSDLFPWLILARAFRIAIQLRLLFLGAVGFFFMIAGWGLLGVVFSGNGEVQSQTAGYGGLPWLAGTREIGSTPRGLEMNPTPEQLKEAMGASRPSLMKRESKPGWGTFAGWEGPFWTAWQPLWSTWEHLSRPFRGVFGSKADYLETLRAHKAHLEYLTALNRQKALALGKDLQEMDREVLEWEKDAQELEKEAETLDKEAQDLQKAKAVRKKAEDKRKKVDDAKKVAPSVREQAQGQEQAAVEETKRLEKESQRIGQQLEEESQEWRKTLGLRKTPEIGLTGRVAFSFLCGLWAVAVWAFFGGAISRAASIELATGDRAKLFRSLNFAGSKWASYFAAPLIPLVGALLIALPVMFAGWLLGLGGVGTFIAALGWPLVLLAGFLMAMLLLGLVFGWPLFWGNLSTEGVDSFDAVGRTYDYVYHRPLNYLFYAIVAALIGALGWLVVANFFEGIIGASYWAASWGASEGQIRLIQRTPEAVQAATQAGADLGAVGQAGSWLIRFWVQGLKFLGVGFLYSYIWVAGSAIYLLLRRDVDATEMDEVLPEEEAEPQPAPLPEVKTDEAGAPVVADQVPTQPEAPKEGEQPAKEGEQPRGRVWSVLDQGEKPPAKEGEQPQQP